MMATAPISTTKNAEFQTARNGEWTLLKKSIHREVYSGKIASGSEFIAKKFFPTPRWKSWLRQTPAHNEWENLSRLRQTGHAVPEPLGFSQDPDGSQWVFQRRLPGHAWNKIDLPSLSYGLRRRALQGFASLLFSLHETGFRDPDRHGGNFWLDPEGKSWAIDFQRAGFGAPLLPLERKKSLAILAASMLGTSRPRDRLRFFHAYLRSSKTGMSDWKTEALDLERMARRLRAEKVWKKSKKCLQENARFESFRAEGYRGIFRRGLNGFEKSTLLSALKEPSQNQMIKKGSRTRVLQTQGPSPWVLKLYEKPSAWARFRSWLGLGRARRAWRNSIWLEIAEAQNSITMGFLEGKNFDVLISKKVNGQPFTLEHSGSVQRAIGRFLARIHLAGIRARDLRRENLLVSAASEPQLIYLVDFDGIRKKTNDIQEFADIRRLLASFPNSNAAQFEEFWAEYRLWSSPTK